MRPWGRRWSVSPLALAGVALAGVALAGVALAGTAAPAAAGEGVDYPEVDAGYHSLAELRQAILALEDAHPGIVEVLVIGESVEGRPIHVVKISDNVDEDLEPDEPEVLFDALHHAREHLTPEMALYLAELLAGRYGEDSDLGRRITDIVDGRVIWIIPMLNPDGWVHDLTAPAKQRIWGPDGEDLYAGWRKNRSPIDGSSAIGVDLNRNYGYRWGCCGGSSGTPSAPTYRGSRPWSTPEVRALRDLVRSRVIDGRQRIKAHITFHTSGEQILYPYGWTRSDRPPEMTRLDQRAFVRLADEMAQRNGYTPMQASDLYIHDGDQISWMYGRQRIFSFTFEMFPTAAKVPSVDKFYPADERIEPQTARNRDAVLYLLEQADCPYRPLGEAARWCGPFFDDLEIDRGWQVDPDGTDTATVGAWQRGIPTASTHQRSDAASGQGVLVTGRAAGTDVDRGRTTIRSPLFRIPENGVATLRLRWWVGMSATATPGDRFTVRLVDLDGVPIGDPLLTVAGDGSRRLPTWQALTAVLPAEGSGQRVAILLQAVDKPADGAATVEAAVDAVRVTVEGVAGRRPRR